MASNLYQLAILLDKPPWKEKAEHMLSSLANVIITYPTSLWCMAGTLNGA